MKKIILSAALFCTGFCAFAQEKSIEDDMDYCLNTAVSTKSQRECMAKAYDSWDAELNQNYKILMEKLPADAKKALQQSQRNWLAYRDAEFIFINKINFEVMSGTIYQIIAAQQKINMVKRRILELKEYIHMLNDNG